MGNSTDGNALERDVVQAAMDWYRWEVRTRVSPQIWPREKDLTRACEKLAKERARKK